LHVHAFVLRERVEHISMTISPYTMGTLRRCLQFALNLANHNMINKFNIIDTKVNIISTQLLSRK